MEISSRWIQSSVESFHSSSTVSDVMFHDDTVPITCIRNFPSMNISEYVSLLHLHIQAGIRIHACACVCVRAHAHTHTLCTCANTHTHTHTHTHIHYSQWLFLQSMGMYIQFRVEPCSHVDSFHVFFAPMMVREIVGRVNQLYWWVGTNSLNYLVFVTATIITTTVSPGDDRPPQL